MHLFLPVHKSEVCDGEHDQVFVLKLQLLKIFCLTVSVHHQHLTFDRFIQNSDVFLVLDLQLQKIENQGFTTTVYTQYTQCVSHIWIDGLKNCDCDCDVEFSSQNHVHEA